MRIQPPQPTIGALLSHAFPLPRDDKETRDERRLAHRVDLAERVRK